MSVDNLSLSIFQVLHPKNPFAPTLHFNYRYFETDAPKGTIVLSLKFPSITEVFLISFCFCTCIFPALSLLIIKNGIANVKVRKLNENH